MFHLYHHHDLDRLAELLSALLEKGPHKHALEPATVIVPNRGVQRWLQMRLAEDAGIAANIQFPLLARFIWTTIPALLPGNPDSSAFERDRMRWHLYAILPDVAQTEPTVAHYIAVDPPDVHRWQLADRLADVFDEYLIYRPSLLANWETGTIAQSDPERWQAAVWRALTRHLGTDHRARLLTQLTDSIAQGKNESGATLPEAVYCFGLSQIPPEYVKFLYAFGQLTHVHFLLPNPCEAYWGDIQSQRAGLETTAAGTEPESDIESHQPLLASFGRGIRDLLRVLYSDELTRIHEPELGPALAYAPPDRSELLARMQADIIRMTSPRDTAGMMPDDVSVQVHACHGPLREIQVLHDQLLDLLTRIPDLTYRDIIVMMSDVNSYAPAIRSVFGSAEGKRHVPYSISEQARTGVHPIVQSFHRLLDLPLSRWRASEILGLAGVVPIAHRFGLDDSSLASLRDWTRAAGVRWGFDAQTRERFNAGDFEQNTWRAGLDRLLLGLVQSDDEALIDGVAPWSDLEGTAAMAVGNLWQLVERLRGWERRLGIPARAAVWQARLNGLVDDMFAPETGPGPESAAIDEIREAIALLDQADECLGNIPISWEVVREVLTAELSLPGVRQPLLSGGITFCGLTPLRAVPFRVVCLLGMNDGDFPRQESSRAFNLLRSRPRIGDYNVRDDDRLTFLQALTAARDVFYVSYTGQDVASGDQLPPSPVIGEWLDFLHQHYFSGSTRREFESRLVTRQPMHPFSTHYFTSNPGHPRLFTFAKEWEPGSRTDAQKRTPAPPFQETPVAPMKITEDREVISLAELRRFFAHPTRYFLQGCLGIHLDPDEWEIEDTEPLKPDALSRHMLRTELFRRAARDGLTAVATSPDRLWRARGTLPPPPLDARPFQSEAEHINALLPIWNEWARDGDPTTLEIDVRLGQERLVGHITGIWPDGPRLLRPGRLRMQHKLTRWIDYLAYVFAGYTGDLRLAGLDTSKPEKYHASINSDKARDYLKTLLHVYRQGLTEPLLFIPDLADDYLRHRITRGKSQQEALAAVNGPLTNSYKRSHYACDPYFSQFFLPDQPLGATPADSAFCRLAEAVCGPPFNHLKEESQ